MARLQSDNDIKRALAKARTIAVVGYSDNPDRDSYRIGRYLRDQGYTVYAVNPTIQAVDGLISYPSLAALPEPVDIVDVFRRAEHLAGVVEEAAAIGTSLVWGQLSVASNEALARANDAGIDIVMNRCIKVDHWRLVRAADDV